jgi:hypothetical protein
VTEALPRHFFLTTTTINQPPHLESMPPRTRGDDKTSRSGHVHAHTPVRKRGPSNAGDQASKRQKKHQEDPDETMAPPDATEEVTRGGKRGKKKGGKMKKGKKMSGLRLQENERQQGC